MIIKYKSKNKTLKKISQRINFSILEKVAKDYI